MATYCSFLGDTTFTGFADRALQSGGRTHLPSGFKGTRSTAWDFALTRITSTGHDASGATDVRDLATVLVDRGLPPAALDDLARFTEAVRATVPQPGIGRCVVDDGGRFAVAVYRVAGSSDLDVRPGDDFVAGVQLSGDVNGGEVLVEPHVLRRRCSNGTVARGPAAATYVRLSDLATEGDLERVVQDSLVGAPARDFVADLRRAAATPQPRPSDLLARGLVRLEAGDVTALLRNLPAEEPTLFGLVNAITKVARDHASLPAALTLEREAGRLVAALIRRSSPGRVTGFGPLPA